jgi:RNA polymerase sigma factor for flagellar operon FliA
VLTATRTYRRCAAQGQRDELTLNHLWLVRHIVGRLSARLPPGVDRENLESAGMLGLVEAANKFDPLRGIQFKTFAYNRIRGAILDELRRNCPLPQQMLEQVARLRQAQAQLQDAPATVETLAEASGLTLDEVADCLAAIRMTEMLSWDEAAEAPTRSGSRTPAPDDELLRTEEKELLAEALAALPERERLAVTLYYLEDLRLREIGEVLHLSESRVSRLLSVALFRVRELLRVRESN